MPGYPQFDLGADYALSGFVPWKRNSLLVVNSFILLAASTAAFTSGVTSLGTRNAAIGLNARTCTVSGQREFVRLEITSGHGATSVNLGDIAFDATPVPEGGSPVVLSTGLAGLGLARRRRRLIDWNKPRAGLTSR
jgi:hypothetical protein